MANLTSRVGMQLAVSELCLDSYVNNIKTIPVLTKEEEKELAERLYNDEDLGAAKKLVVSHLRFVLYIVHGYRGYGLSEADLIQEGNIGLMKAVKRFNPNVGVRLVSFAIHWIRAEIHEFILRNWRIVKVVTTKAQRKLFFNLRSMKKRLGWLSHAEVVQIANDLGVSNKDVLEMEKRMTMQDVAFDGPTNETEDDEKNFAPAAYLEDYRYNPAAIVEEADWKSYGNEQLHSAFEKLDARSQDILKKRWLSDKKITLQELAKHYKVSAERIRQIENNAMKKLKKQINFAV
ncbi:RNA polymerase sigma factor RpoH [Candidatus Halobeggiatoa sp. HSG11]|nr:RNA polymerase sigma factor RpoH [Candidatus Halobeggiatoa sp. HSG11]